MLGKRGFPLECAAAQVCREAGARVASNVFVRTRWAQVGDRGRRSYTLARSPARH